MPRDVPALSYGIAGQGLSDVLRSQRLVPRRHPQRLPPKVRCSCPRFAPYRRKSAGSGVHSVAPRCTLKALLVPEFAAECI